MLCVLTLKVHSQADEAWKRRNDRGNRYEGLVSIRTGNPDLEVLGFIGFFEPFSDNVNLKVRFFVPSAAKPSIIAHEVEEEKQYWMEVKPQDWTVGAWNEFHPWPTGDVIFKEGIPWNNVTVLIRVGADLAPAFIYHRRSPNSAQSYILYLRSNRNLRSVHLTISGKSLASQPILRVVRLGRQAANVPFPVRLDLSNFGEGHVRVMIERSLRNSPQTLPVHEYGFYHKAELY